MFGVCKDVFDESVLCVVWIYSTPSAIYIKCLNISVNLVEKLLSAKEACVLENFFEICSYFYHKLLVEEQCAGAMETFNAL